MPSEECVVPRTSTNAKDLEDARKATRVRIALAATVVVLVLWSHWPTLCDLWEIWQTNQDYSVGQLVPLVAAYLVWSDRKALAAVPSRVCWWGLGLLVFAQFMRVTGVYFFFGSAERYSIVLTIAGLVLLLLGPAMTRRLLWILAFLLLALPLSRRVHGAISSPLQNFATTSAVFGLEMIGFLVQRDGNTLRIGNTHLAVAEACNGLRMLTAFVVVAATLAFVVRRPPWQKAFLVASSIPVAILANTVRLVVTGVLYELAGSQTAERFFHDFAGITMMPIAVFALMGELWLIRWITGSGPTSPEKTHAGRPADKGRNQP